MVSGTVINDLTQTVVILLCMSLFFYFFRHQKLKTRAIIDYENQFLELHYETIERQRVNDEEIIPLTFERQDQEYLVYLCRIFRKNWLTANCADKCFQSPRDPSVEQHYFHFRTLKRTPARMKIQLVRCAEKYALVDAGNNGTGYFLQLNKDRTDANHMVFSIAKKFRYNQQPLRVIQGIELPTHQGPAQ